MITRRLALVAALGGILSSFGCAAQENNPVVSTAGKSPLGCDVASIQAAAPEDTTIVSASLLDTPAPNCKVEGYVTTVNPGPNQVNFVLQLPATKDSWNGRFYFGNQGGSGGAVPIAERRRGLLRSSSRDRPRRRGARRD